MKRFVVFLSILCTLLSCGNGSKSYDEWKAECDSVGDYSDGFALCEKEGKWFFIDESGKKRSQDYDMAEAFHNQYAVVNKYIDGHEMIIFLDKNFNEKAYPILKIFGNVNTSGNVWVTLRDHRSTHLLNIESGSFKANLESDEQLGSMSSEGVVMVWKNPRKKKKQYDASTAKGISSALVDIYNANWERVYFELLDVNGDTIAPFGKFSYIGEFHNGMAKYSTTGYLKASDRNDERIRTLNEEAAKRGYVYGLIGFINGKGEIAIPERYYRTFDFNKSGYCPVSYKLHSSMGEACEHIINRNGDELSGRDLIVAKGSFMNNGHWESGRDEDGNLVMANNQGVVKTMEPGGKWATVKNLLAQKEGKIYKFYRLSNDDVNYLFTIEGTGKSDEVICYRNAHIIEVFNGRYCQKYDDETGQLITEERLVVGPHDMVRYGHRLHEAFEYAAFFFK